MIDLAMNVYKQMKEKDTSDKSDTRSPSQNSKGSASKENSIAKGLSRFAQGLIKKF
jgi:hypothetical protein